MTQDFKFAHRKARRPALLLAALLFTLASCNSTDVLTPENPADAEIIDNGSGSDVPSMAIAYAGGIPMGTWALPTSWFGSSYNGAMRTISPNEMRSELAGIKARGGKVILSLAGAERYFLDSNHRFSMTKWKERVNRHRGVDFSSYIKDGTIIGHYLIDEPNDPRNWGGRPVSQATVEEMAKYSKQLWPGMATIVRAEASYMAKWSGTYRYLDAAWAQYVSWKGTPGDFIRRNVADAQRKGLALVTGLNIIHGNNHNKMTATQIKRWGSELLSSSYPCAFVSWSFNSSYLSSSSIRDAMRTLRSRAQSRPFRTCRG